MRISLFVTEDWYVASHRLPVVQGATARGDQVQVLTHVDRHRSCIEHAGAEVIHVPLDRSSYGPLQEARTVRAVYAAIRHFRPHIVHNVALKPVIYGTAAAALAGTPAVLNAMAGMGALFLSDPARGMFSTHRAIQLALARSLKAKRSWSLVQNDDDSKVVQSLGVGLERVRVIPGSGVDLAAFPFVELPPGSPVVVRYFGRLLEDKGLRELRDAAKLLRIEMPNVRVELVGTLDRHNPACLHPDELRKWHEEGDLVFRGHVNDVRPLMQSSHMVVLPSYREGLPKVLLEACATGRPMITTDVPGCRDVVRQAENGLLVKPRSAEALASAIAELAGDLEQMARMGRRARQIAEAEFGVERVVTSTLELYDMIAGR